MNFYHKVALASGLLCASGILVGFVGFPMLLRTTLRRQLNLRPGSETRRMWEKFPIPLNFSVYVFNVTNPDEVQNGAKPRLAEVGPFVFEEWKDKFNIEDLEDEDAVAFNMRNTFVFRPERGLSGEELVTMPHPLVQFIAISIKRDKAPMLPMIAEGLEVLFQPDSAFVSAPFMELFYRGLDVDCSRESFAANAICLNFHTGGVRGAAKLNETHFKFSLMGAGNHSDAGRFKVSRGVRVSRDVGRVLQFGDEDELSVWPGEECNRFRGTDSTVFAPLMPPAAGLWTYSPDLCRSLGPRLERRVRYAGLPALRYRADFGDVRNEPANRCFCQDFPDDCPAKGTMDLAPCNELPMVASMPHFLNGDPRLLAAVEGLRPDEAKHGIFIDFEIISGTPLSLAKRLQFNLAMEPVAEVRVMQGLPKLTMPLFWVEEALDLDATFTDMLQRRIFRILNANNAFKWIASTVGGFGLLFALYLARLSRNRVQATSVDQVQGKR